MSLSFSRNVFFATTALMMTCSTIRAGPADELIKQGDDFDLKLQASEALIVIWQRKSWSPRAQVSFCGSHGSIAT